jgi:lipopolysaccharide transport system permease protein
VSGVPGAAVWQLAGVLVRNRRVLVASSGVELRKRYAGSVLGPLWVVLQPLLLLAVYLFVYLGIFNIRMPGGGRFDYVLYVFAGLVPYIAIMDAVSAAPTLLKQNIHLVRNALLPIELVAARPVVNALVNQSVALVMVVVLSALAGHLTWHVAWIPLAIACQAALLLGAVWGVSALGVLLPDTAYVVNLVLLVLLYISPIGYTPEMVPEHLRALVAFNPVYYLITVFRNGLVDGHVPAVGIAAAYVALCATVFVLGGAFFRRVKDVAVDYE